MKRAAVDEPRGAVKRKCRIDEEGCREICSFCERQAVEGVKECFGCKQGFCGYCSIADYWFGRDTAYWCLDCRR